MSICVFTALSLALLGSALAGGTDAAPGFLLNSSLLLLQG